MFVSLFLVAVSGLAWPIPDQEPKVTFEEDVAPIFQGACFPCHDPSRANGGLDLSTFAGTLAGGGSGEVVLPQDLDGSRLWQLVTHQASPKMPPQGKLGDDSLGVIRQWIEGGLLENKGSKAKPKKKPAVDLQFSSGELGTELAVSHRLSKEPFSIPRRGSATRLALNPRSSLVALGSVHQVLLYDLRDLRLAGVLPFSPGTPQDLRFTRDGRFVLVSGGRGGRSGHLQLHELIEGDQALRIDGFFDALQSADLCSDGSRFLVGGTDRRLSFLDAVTHEVIAFSKKHTDWITSVAFSPDGVLAASGDRSGALYVWEAVSGREFYALEGHQGAITRIDFRADSNLLVSSGEDGRVRTWAMANGKRIKDLNAHPGGATSARFSTDGRVISTGRDRTVKLWDQAGKAIGELKGLSDIGVDAVLDSRTDRACVTTWDGKASVWDVTEKVLIGELDNLPQPISTWVVAAKERALSLEAERKSQGEMVEAARETRESVEAESIALNETMRNLEKNEAETLRLFTQSTKGLEEWQGKLEEAEVRWNEANTRRQAIPAELDDLNQSIKQGEERIQVLESVIPERRALVDSVRATYESLQQAAQKDPSLEKAASQSHEALTACESSLSALEAESQDCRDLCSQKANEVERLQSEQEQWAQEFPDRQRELDHASQEHDSALENQRRRERVHDEATAALSKTQERARELEKTLTQSKQRLATLEASLLETLEKVEQAQDEDLFWRMAQGNEDRRSARKRWLEEQEAYERAREPVRLAEAKRQKQRDRLEMIRNRQEGIPHDVRKLRSQRVRKLRLVQEQEAERDSQQGQFDQAKEEVDALEALLRQMKPKGGTEADESLEKALAHMVDALDSLQARSRGKKENFEACCRDVQLAQDEVTALEGELTQLRAEQKKIVLDLEDAQEQLKCCDLEVEAEEEKMLPYLQRIEQAEQEYRRIEAEWLRTYGVEEDAKTATKSS